ncbi:MAG: hypothetical protein D6693_02720 [Planctomycetota bacterium]|nr:MAG: hypothetical protein D6693_02720 [Planctomycetota bacterium]
MNGKRRRAAIAAAGLGCALCLCGGADAQVIGSHELEPNDVFAQRTVLTGSAGCRWRAFYTAKLGGVDQRVPDTMVCFTGFAQEFCTAQNDDGGAYAAYGGSAVTGQSSAGPFQVRVTGSGNLGFGNGFNHGEVGPFEVYIDFFDAASNYVGTTTLSGTLTGTNTVLFSNVAVLPGAATFDITVNPLVSEQGDVDFFEFVGLRPNAPYEVRIIAGIDDRTGTSLDTVMGEYTSFGSLTANVNDDIGPVPNPFPPPATAIDRRSVITVTSDATGSMRFAVSGWFDFDFDGLLDGASPPRRHPRTGQYTFRVAHICGAGCADVNGDCVVNGLDITAVLNKWNTVCP